MLPEQFFLFLQVSTREEELSKRRTLLLEWQGWMSGGLGKEKMNILMANLTDCMNGGSTKALLKRQWLWKLPKLLLLLIIANIHVYYHSGIMVSILHGLSHLFSRSVLQVKY